jgi:hypothetical protein
MLFTARDEKTIELARLRYELKLAKTGCKKRAARSLKEIGIFGDQQFIHLIKRR